MIWPCSMLRRAASGHHDELPADPFGAPQPHHRPDRQGPFDMGVTASATVVIGLDVDGHPGRLDPADIDLEDHQIIGRSEEHTSELQSRGHLVCRLLLEKKKTTN